MGPAQRRLAKAMDHLHPDKGRIDEGEELFDVQGYLCRTLKDGCAVSKEGDMYQDPVPVAAIADGQDAVELEESEDHMEAASSM